MDSSSRVNHAYTSPPTNIGGAGTLVPEQTVSTVEELFANERSALRARLSTDPQLAPFRFLPDPILTFLCGEKMRLSLTADARVVRNESGEIITGYEHDYNCKDDEYHPNQWNPFELKGYWIPEEEGQLFTVQREENCPLVRMTQRGREVLFLIHPKSEHLYTPLMQKYSDQKVLVPALSLSSFRTLLIAIPHTLPQYAMVKVTLDEKVGGAHRILSLKECAGSVGLTAILHQKSSSITFLKENVSFVPNNHLLNGEFPHAQQAGAGMIHRPIPDILLQEHSQKHVIPLFALFGANNRLLLELLIKRSGRSPTDFVRDFLLKPLANIFVDLIYFQHTSIEAHGQNLLLAIDISQPNNLSIDFIYRDMGGVNCQFSDKERASLPDNTKSESYYYENTHFEDTADVLEYFSRRVLFNFTKQFFKSETFGHLDPEFSQWKSATIRHGFEENWSVQDANPDAHGQNFTLGSFYRYGYFEKIFGIEFLNALTQKGIFIELSMVYKHLSYEIFAAQLPNIYENPYHTCVELVWFKNLILQTYPAYRQIS